MDAQLGIVTSPGAPDDRSVPVDIVVSLGEINDEHGTGPLVKRVFKDRSAVFSIRSRDDWGVHNFGDWHTKISLQGKSRPECFREILNTLSGRKIRSVTCVPFLADELLLSIAIKEAFGAKLCLWVMDDQNIAAGTIPDAMMRECLSKCSLRLFTHQELRVAYQQKYGLSGYILPAVVPAHLVAEQPVQPAYNLASGGVLLGSFWDQSWFDRLCSVLERCSVHIDWYGQNRSPWVRFPEEALTRAGIKAFGIIPEEKLAAELRNYPFVIVPVGALDDRETNRGVASLSLPGRILFAAATSHTPVLVVGSEHTCGARFVKQFGIGTVVPYDASAVGAAMHRLGDPQVQMEMRRNAAAIAPALTDFGVGEWLATSMDQGFPADDRFERIFCGYNSIGLLPSCTANPGLPSARSRAAGTTG
jgi:hypothetical protein